MFPRRPLHAATLTALLGLGLAIPPAYAQTLDVGFGDNVTVSGAGTTGVYQGKPINNKTTTYDDTHASDNAAVFTVGPSTFTLGDGGTLTDTQYYGLYAEGNGGVVNIVGGTITAAGQALVALNSTVHVSGGSISGSQTGLITAGTSAATVSGGSITGYGDGFDAAGSGPVTISGGTITAVLGEGVFATGGAVTITGGNISSLNSAGLYNESTINLFSQGDTPFLIDGVPMNNTSLTRQYTGVGNTISGTLLNGDRLNTTFISYGTINLNIMPSPEPSQTAALALGALGLAALARRAHRRAAA